jgi:hypothetical protein
MAAASAHDIKTLHEKTIKLLTDREYAKHNATIEDVHHLFLGPHAHHSIFDPPEGTESSRKVCSPELTTLHKLTARIYHKQWRTNARKINRLYNKLKKQRLLTQRQVDSEPESDVGPENL